MVPLSGTSLPIQAIQAGFDDNPTIRYHELVSLKFLNSYAGIRTNTGKGGTMWLL
jgi:hypothetical protein